MTDAEALKAQQAESFEWLMTNGRIALDCGIKMYRPIRRGFLAYNQFRGIRLFSGDQDLWWLVAWERGGSFDPDLRRYTCLLLAEEPYPIYSGTEQAISATRDLSQDPTSFTALSIDPKRLADLLVAYLHRTAGIAHKEMKRFCAQPDIDWEPDHASDCGDRMVHCYKAVTLVERSTLWRIPK